MIANKRAVVKGVTDSIKVCVCGDEVCALACISCGGELVDDVLLAGVVDTGTIVDSIIDSVTVMIEGGELREVWTNIFIGTDTVCVCVQTLWVPVIVWVAC